MAVLPGTTTEAEVLANAVRTLLNLRAALEAAADLYGWTSGNSAADLATLGMDAGTAAALLSAVADANALQVLYDTGSLPGSYTLPYVFGASQRRLIGPQ